MYSFQFLFRASLATLLLVLCLQLGTSQAQEDTRKVLTMDLQVPQTAKANEEFSVTLKIQTELRECMVSCRCLCEMTCSQCGGESYTFDPHRQIDACGQGKNVLSELAELWQNTRAYLISNVSMSGTSQFKQTGCLCEDYPRSFFWDIQSNDTVKIAAVVDIVRERGICPEDYAVVPIQANRFFAIRTIIIEP